MNLPRPSLCPRCGGIQEVVRPEPGQRVVGRCPSCGLGFAATAMVATRSSEPLDDAAEAEHRRLKAEQQARKRSAASRCSFGVYGLDDTWSGRRWFGGWSESDGELASVELAHGDAFDEGKALLRVRTEPVSQSTQHLHLDAVPARLFAVRSAAQSLAQHLWHAGADHSAALQSTFTDEDPTRQWVPLSLVLDGQPLIFRSLGGWMSWVAVGITGDVVIGVQARNMEPAAVRLVVLDDLERYLEDDGMPR